MKSTAMILGIVLIAAAVLSPMGLNLLNLAPFYVFNEGNQFKFIDIEDVELEIDRNSEALLVTMNLDRDVCRDCTTKHLASTNFEPGGKDFHIQYDMGYVVNDGNTDCKNIESNVKSGLHAVDGHKKIKDLKVDDKGVKREVTFKGAEGMIPNDEDVGDYEVVVCIQVWSSEINTIVNDIYPDFIEYRYIAVSQVVQKIIQVDGDDAVNADGKVDLDIATCSHKAGESCSEKGYIDISQGDAVYTVEDKQRIEVNRNDKVTFEAFANDGHSFRGWDCTVGCDNDASSAEIEQENPVKFDRELSGDEKWIALFKTDTNPDEPGGDPPACEEDDGDCSGDGNGNGNGNGDVIFAVAIKAAGGSEFGSISQGTKNEFGCDSLSDGCNIELDKGESVDITFEPNPAREHGSTSNKFIIHYIKYIKVTGEGHAMTYRGDLGLDFDTRCNTEVSMNSDADAETQVCGQTTPKTITIDGIKDDVEVEVVFDVFDKTIPCESLGTCGGNGEDNGGLVDPGGDDCSGNLESEDNQCHTPPAEAEKEARAAFDEITGEAQANATPEQGAGSMPAIPRNMLVIVGSILIVYGVFGSGRRFG